MKDDEHRDLSTQLYERMCQSGFTAERIKLQSHLVDHLEELYKDLYDQEQYQWFIAGSYGDVWGNHMFTFDGRTDEHESDIDWTCNMHSSQFHFKESCKCDTVSIDERRMFSISSISEGHIQSGYEFQREPAEPHDMIGMRPKVDECSAYPCCSIPTGLLSDNAKFFDKLVSLDQMAQMVQLIQASRPGHESLELRFSFSRVERSILRQLNVVQGHLFILIKYFLLNKFNVDIFAFKSYHAKTLLFHTLQRFETSTEWKPEMLVSLLLRSFDLLLEFIHECASLPTETSQFHAAMKSFFLKDCFIYYHKKIFTDRPHNLLIDIIGKTKVAIATDINKYMGLLKPLQAGKDGLIFHPYLLFPIRLTLQFYKPKNADNLYTRMHSCLQELTVLRPDKKTDFLRHLESLPPCAFTASLCLKAMAHLKVGDKPAAIDLLKKHQYHTVQYQVSIGEVSEVKERLNATDTAWCFAFTYDQMEPLDFSFLGNDDVYTYCIVRSNSYPVDVIVDFNCLARVLHQQLCPDNGMLDRWREDLELKKAPLPEVYIHSRFSLKAEGKEPIHHVFDVLNRSIRDGVYDRMFFATLIDSFSDGDHTDMLQAFCDWMKQHLTVAHFICLYCVCRVSGKLLLKYARELLPDALQRAETVAGISLPYRDFEMLLTMRRRLCKVKSEYLSDWQERIKGLVTLGKLNLQEIFSFLKSAGRCGDYSHLRFALDLLRESPMALSFLKLKDYRLLAQAHRKCVGLQHSYLDPWLEDIRKRMADPQFVRDKAPFLVTELSSLIDCLVQTDAIHAERCNRLLNILSNLDQSKSDRSKIDRMRYLLVKIS